MRRKGGLAARVVLGICSISLSYVAEAQEPARLFRIGWLSAGNAPVPFAGSFSEAFTKRLRERGYIACWAEPQICRSGGQNAEIVIRRAEGKSERLPVLAAELVALRPDVIVSLTTPATRAAKQATATIPIVIAQT